MHQAFPAAEDRSARLLLDSFGCHETHLALACRNDKRLSIGRIIFLPLHKRAHVLRCDHLYLGPRNVRYRTPRKSPCWALLSHEREELLPRQALAELDIPRSKGAMNLENCLCQIDPDHMFFASPSSSARGVEHHELGTLRCRLRRAATTPSDLACGHEEPDRPSLGIADGVQLGVHAALGAPDLAPAPSVLTAKLVDMRWAFR